MATRRIRVNGIDRLDPRHTRAWRRLRDQVVREEPVCRLRITGVCTGASTTAAHIRPVTTYPELALERSNLRGSCAACNSATGTMPLESIRVNGDEPPALGVFG